MAHVPLSQLVWLLSLLGVMQKNDFPKNKLLAKLRLTVHRAKPKATI